MSDGTDGKTGTGEAGAGAGGGGSGDEVFRLANALRFERAKNQVLLDEVIALEDEMVNRSMADFEAVVSDETREFWREQLLTNREAATVALGELARAMQREPTPASGHPSREGIARRPLHNRSLARPVVPGMASGGTASPAGGSEADERAAKIRNRAQEISRAERVPFSAAFRRAEKELSGKG